MLERVIIFTLLMVLFAPHSARADTSADCGRFYLKWDEETQQMKCVGNKRTLKVSSHTLNVLGRQVAQTTQRLQRVLTGAEGILRTRQLSQDVERRTRQLVNEVRQRTEELRRLSEELKQAVDSRTQNLGSAQRQFVQRQTQLAQELEQTQRSLTQQLIAEQRGRTQELLR